MSLVSAVALHLLVEQPFIKLSKVFLELLTSVGNSLSAKLKNSEKPKKS
jgi:hypothetical protein